MDVQALKNELAQVRERIPKNGQETEEAQKRIEEARSKHRSLGGQVQDAREQRQKILADQGDAKEVNKALSRLKESYELLEDAEIGLDRKLSDLEQEKVNLDRIEKELQGVIMKEETIRPLLAQYNDLATKMAEVLTKAESALFQYDCFRTVPFAPPLVICERDAWDNSALAWIPALSLSGEEVAPTIYRRRDVISELKTSYINEKRTLHELQQKEDREAREKKQKELEREFANAPCFGCKWYTGLNWAEHLSCTAFKDRETGIPLEILEGKDGHMGGHPEDGGYRYEPKQMAHH